MNIYRGRGQEVPGEDPFLTGQYVMQFSYNFQFGEDNKYLKSVTVCKHYADYDQEGNFGIGRTSFDANVTMLSQLSIYLLCNLNEISILGKQGRIRWNIIGQHGEQQYKQQRYKVLCVHIMQLMVFQVVVMIIS